MDIFQNFSCGEERIEVYGTLEKPLFLVKNIAKVFKQMGWFVTGSDNQFLPPASNILEDNKINFVEGFSYRHLDRDFWSEKLNEDLDYIGEHPDLVLFISHLTSKNKEYLEDIAKSIDIKIEKGMKMM